MASPDEDIRDLRAALDALRGRLAAQSEILVRIESMLSERCVTRGLVQDKLVLRVEALECRFWWMGGASAVIGMIAGWILGKLGSGNG